MLFPRLLGGESVVSGEISAKSDINRGISGEIATLASPPFPGNFPRGRGKSSERGGMIHLFILNNTHPKVASILATYNAYVQYIGAHFSAAIVGGRWRAGGNCGSTMMAPLKWRTHATLTKSVFCGAVQHVCKRQLADGPRI